MFWNPLSHCSTIQLYLRSSTFTLLGQAPSFFCQFAVSQLQVAPGTLSAAKIEVTILPLSILLAVLVADLLS